VIAILPDQFRLLLGNEFRLYRRSGKFDVADLGFLMLGQLILHAAALGVALMWMGKPAALRISDTLAIAMSAGLLGALLLMVSRALAGAVQALYTRGDLDLLLSSPVDRRAVLGVRMAAIAATVTLEVALLVWPFANVFVLFGHFAWFKAYLLVPGMAMLATSIGLAVTLLCFRTIGPRRTRVVVQVLAALVGMGMMLAIYLPGMFSDNTAPGPVGGLRMLASHADYRELLVAPAHWVADGAWPVILFFAAAAGLLVSVVHLTGERIVGALTGISGLAVRTARAATGAVRFHASFRRVIVQKELRLIARDPFLLTQILQQSLMVLPVAFGLWRARFGVDLPLAWLSVIWLAGGLAAPLSWLTLLAEDAPDLLASAPVTRAALMRAKLEAALLPVLPICVLPLCFLLGTHPWFGISTTLCSAGAAVSCAAINMGNPVAQRRDSFKTRHQGGGAHGLLVGLLMFFWMGIAALLIWIGTRLGWN
jgi:ABC-2 type transport system permease protein